MANLGNFFGPMLTGIGQGLQSYQQTQEDFSYTRQARAQDLAFNQSKIQAQELQNQQQQLAMQNAEATNNFYKQALADTATPSQQGQAVAQQATPNAPQQQQAPASRSAFDTQSPMSVDQLASLDKKYGLPIGTAYGIMHAESAGKPDAVSPVGAQGLFQVMPATAAQPGYGLKAFNPKDPDGAMGYFAALYKKAGGDMGKALGYWNAGPAGNPNNPETQGFIPRVQKGAQSFASAYGLDQSKQQPTPADQINTREASGANTPVTQYQQAVSAQDRQIQTLRAAGDKASQAGNFQIAQGFYGQADKLQGQQLDLQKKALDAQKEANEETTKLANGVKDQGSYNGFMQQVAQNPAMQAAVAGLNLTGDYNADRNKMQTLANRSLTLKDQQDMQLKQQEFALKAQKEQREQAKEDAVKVQAQQVQEADTKRQVDLQQKGIPFAPSVVAGLPAGANAATVQKAQKAVQDQQVKYQQANMNSQGANKNVMGYASTLIGLLDSKSNPVSTGGVLQNFVPGYGKFRTAHDNQRQEFDKVSNQIVTQAQMALGAQGGSRSAFTAAMYDRIKTQKPGLDLSPETNRKIAGEYYNIAAMGANKSNFMNEYMQANPGALPQTGELQWAAYEQSLGPSVIVDPDAEGGYRLNTAGVPKLPDGRPNPNYKDYHDFFRSGG